MNLKSKISSLEFLEAFKGEKTQKTVLCYGHFNILHPGHFRFLEHARSMGDRVIVFLMDDDRLPTLNRQNYFPIKDRARALAALEIVDQVIIPGDKMLEEAVRQLEPNYLLLGKEQENNSDPEINKAIKELEKQGKQVLFHAGDIQYSSSLLRMQPSEVGDEYRTAAFLESCARQNISKKDVLATIKGFKNINVAIIGDSIVDQFIACDALGMSAEAPVIVVRELEAKKFIGGGAIVAAHAQALGANCSFISVVGDDDNAGWLEEALREQNIVCHLFRDNSRPTTFKTRYMVEQQKMFRVSRLKEHNISASIEKLVRDKIENIAPNTDAIILSDFVYGLLSPSLVKFVTEFAAKKNILLFGDVQCSTQRGSLLKFKGFDTLFPTEREARVALDSNDGGLEWLANQIIEKTSTQRLVLKLGSQGFVTYEKNDDDFVRREHFPALISNPVDVSGAGDSLMAAFVLSLISGGNAMVASAIAASVAAISVSQVGNQPISIRQLTKRIEKEWGDHGEA